MNLKSVFSAAVDFLKDGFQNVTGDLKNLFNGHSSMKDMLGLGIGGVAGFALGGSLGGGSLLAQFACAAIGMTVGSYINHKFFDKEETSSAPAPQAPAAGM